MDPCNEIKIENPLKLKCEYSSKNPNQKHDLSDQLIAIERIFNEILFPELKSRTGRMKSEFRRCDVMPEHNSLNEFFKRNVHLAGKNNQICNHFVSILIRQANKYAFSNVIIDIIKKEGWWWISVENYIKIETDFWNNFLTNINEANSEKSICDEPHLKSS